jgi:hypothetical protein
VRDSDDEQGPGRADYGTTTREQALVFGCEMLRIGLPAARSLPVVVAELALFEQIDGRGVMERPRAAERWTP